MNKPTKRILIGSFFISLLLWGGIFFFFPQEMTNDGLQKMLKENNNVYYLSNVKEKELPGATFSSQKRTNNNTLKDNSFVPMVSYTPLAINVNVNNSGTSGMENYFSGTLYSQNVLTPDPVNNNGGNISVGFLTTFSSGRSNTSNRVESNSLSKGVSLSEPFSSNTPFSSNPRLVDYTPNSGGTDPGGDPEGPPIPVGDGIGFLVSLTLGYGGIKKKPLIFKKQN